VTTEWELDPQRGVNKHAPGKRTKRIQRIKRNFSLPHCTHIFPSSCGPRADSVFVESQDGSYFNSSAKLIVVYMFVFVRVFLLASLRL